MDVTEQLIRRIGINGAFFVFKNNKSVAGKIEIYSGMSINQNKISQNVEKYDVSIILLDYEELFKKSSG